MPIIMCCPYYVKEIRHNNGARVGVECEGGRIQFKSKEARRAYIYPLCASVKGYKECPIYKALARKTDA